MERTTSKQLFKATDHRVTRYQVNQIQRTFPLLHLPAELRNIIYVYSIDLNGVDKVFRQTYEKIVRSKNDRLPSAKTPRKTSPTIFLLNKQIYEEASYLFRKNQTVKFSHGLLNVDNLSTVISANVLRQVTSIEITDAGHPIIKGSILPTSWSGYMRLLTQLGEILVGGHQLKKLTIDFQDSRLKEHMTTCHEAQYSCGFRDQMSTTLNSLHKVRDIKQVVLKGLNAAEAQKLKQLMEKPTIGFMTLPRELRDMVYSHTMDWSTSCSDGLARALANWTGNSARFPFPKRVTPNVLLLNKEIHSEALQSLRREPLNISFPADHCFETQSEVPSILSIISRGALKQAKVIHFNMECWEWIFNFEGKLVAALAASQHLEEFHLTFQDKLKGSFMLLPGQRYPDAKIHENLKELTAIRGLKRVTFSGDLPAVYTHPLSQIMTTKPSAAEVLPKLEAVQRDGKVVDAITSSEEEAQE